MTVAATGTYTTGSLIFWGAVIFISGCVIGGFIGYRSGKREGENRAIRDIKSMERRPLEQKLSDYRRTLKQPNVQNRNRSKKK
ncbi:MAG TPA: hypothetical protein VEH31_09120 [Streptosporangiaceae bacterium]|nr:hypothetical protein [Streptosporangiaceae bacterium]